MPAGNDAVLMLRTPGFTVTVKVLVAVLELLSVTLNVTLGVPETVGVPLMAPPLERLRPEGRAPVKTLHEYPAPLPPLAAMVAE